MLESATIRTTQILTAQRIGLQVKQQPGHWESDRAIWFILLASEAVTTTIQCNRLNCDVASRLRYNVTIETVTHYCRGENLVREKYCVSVQTYDQAANAQRCEIALITHF